MGDRIWPKVWPELLCNCLESKVTLHTAGRRGTWVIGNSSSHLRLTVQAVVFQATLWTSIRRCLAALATTLDAACTTQGCKNEIRDQLILSATYRSGTDHAYDGHASGFCPLRARAHYPLLGDSSTNMHSQPTSSSTSLLDLKHMKFLRKKTWRITVPG